MCFDCCNHHDFVHIFVSLVGCLQYFIQNSLALFSYNFLLIFLSCFYFIIVHLSTIFFCKQQILPHNNNTASSVMFYDYDDIVDYLELWWNWECYCSIYLFGFKYYMCTCARIWSFKKKSWKQIKLSACAKFVCRLYHKRSLWISVYLARKTDMRAVKSSIENLYLFTNVSSE